MSIRHMRVDVRGALKNPKAFKDCITVDGKVLKSTDEIMEFFMDHLSQGHEFLPIGDCEGFDYKTGCPGHEDPAP